MSRDVIDNLVNELTPTPPSPRLAMPRLVLAGVAAVSLLAWLLMGNRFVQGDPSLSALSWIKLLPFVAGLVGFGMLARDAMVPGRRVGARSIMVLAVVGLSIGGFVAAGLLVDGAGSIVHAMAWRCVLAVPLLAVPGAMMLWPYARRGAATRPALAGACLGATAGMGAAIAYGMSCHVDRLAFVGVWYCVGVMIAAGIGALAGVRGLRW